MVRTALCLVILLASAAPSTSEPWLKPLFVRLPPLAVEGDQGRPAAPQTRAALEEANAKAAALMNAFEHRIGQKAHRATSSICHGCSLSAQETRPPFRRVEASALPEEHIVDDPAQAPTD